MTDKEYQLRRELERLEDEFEYQVSHKRLNYLRTRIKEIEEEIAAEKRRNKGEDVK